MTMTNIDILLLLLASLCALVVMGVLSSPNQKLSKDEEDLLRLFDVVRGSLSYQWKFSEEIVDEIRSITDPDVVSCIQRIYLSHGYGSNDHRLWLNILLTLAVHEEIEDRILCYSRVALENQPLLFQCLPAWKRAECEDFLLQVEKLAHGAKDSMVEDVELELLQFRKTIPKSGHKEDKTEDLGLQLAPV